MTAAQARRLNEAITKAMRLARQEQASNRLQNYLSSAIVIVRKEMRTKK